MTSCVLHHIFEMCAKHYHRKVMSSPLFHRPDTEAALNLGGHVECGAATIQYAGLH